MRKPLQMMHFGPRTQHVILTYVENLNTESNSLISGSRYFGLHLCGYLYLYEVSKLPIIRSCSRMMDVTILAKWTSLGGQWMSC